MRDLLKRYIPRIRPVATLLAANAFISVPLVVLLVVLTGVFIGNEWVHPRQRGGQNNTHLFNEQVSAQENIFSGKIFIAIEEDLTTKQFVIRYFLETSDRRKYELQLSDSDKAKLSSGSQVELRGEVQGKTIKVSQLSVMAANQTKSLDTQFSRLTLPTSPRKVGVILVNFRNDTSKPLTRAQAKDLVFNQTNRYFKESSEGKLSLTGKLNATGDVFGWYTINVVRNCADYLPLEDISTQAQIKAKRDGFVFENYNHVVYLIPRSNCSFNGTSFFSGKESWVAHLSPGIVAHELLHQMGLWHANSLACKDITTGKYVTAPTVNTTRCEHREYGDIFDVLGDGGYGIPRHTNNIYKYMEGWYSENNLLTVTQTGHYTLYPQAVKTDQARAIRIPISGAAGGFSRYYYLEFRRPTARYDTFATSDPVVNGISIRLVDQHTEHSFTQPNGTLLLDASPDGNLTDASLKEGFRFVDREHNIIVKTTAITATSARVQISFCVPDARGLCEGEAEAFCSTNCTQKCSLTPEGRVCTSSGTDPICKQCPFSNANLDG